MPLLKLYKERTANGPDTEHTQALLRVVIETSACLYLIYLRFTSSIGIGVVAIALSSFTFSILLLLHILRYPHVNIPRRIIGLIHDPLITTWIFYLVNEKMAMYLFVYTWVAIGNGFRFGVRYLYASAALGTLGIAVLLFLSPSWQANWYYSIGIFITNIAVTAYTGALLHQLKSAQSKLERIATQDSLTGLANRRLLIEKLRIAIILSQRHSHHLSLLYFDLDNFKPVNDKYGHHLGDDLLRTVATNVRECIRESDTFARLGGDEFVIIFDYLTSHDDAILGSHRVLKVVESITEVRGHPLKVSASIGMATLNSAKKNIPITPENFIKAADKAMYTAKKNGKGRVEFVEA